MAKRTAKEPLPAPIEIPEGDPHIDPPPDGFDDEEAEKNFAQLRYYFWTFLHYEVRNFLISEIEIAPDPGRMVPQTIEMNALKTAQNTGKLSQLWDLMMPFLPPRRRAKNPFPIPLPPIDYQHIRSVVVAKEPDGAHKLVIKDSIREYEVVGRNLEKCLRLLRQNGWPMQL